jgi:CheY-like chemotaxis protein
MKPLSVLIADDHEVVRRGIRALLEARLECKICGEAATGREAAEKARKLRPDLVLPDLAMPESGGREAIQEILDACPGTKILVLTMNDCGGMASRVLAACARGLVLKSDAARDLVRAVQSLESFKRLNVPTVPGLRLRFFSLFCEFPDNLKNVRTAIEAGVPHGRTNHSGSGDRGAWHDIPQRNGEVWAGQLKSRYDSISETGPWESCEPPGYAWDGKPLYRGLSRRNGDSLVHAAQRFAWGWQPYGQLLYRSRPEGHA